jgi:Uma2 family endonuclease
MAATTELPTDTFDNLHARLGSVPLSRIRTKPAPGSATEEDLLRAPKPICELIDGVLVEKPVGNRESVLGGYILGLLRMHIEPSDLGVVLGEAGYIRVQEDQLRAPDVTFIPWSSFPNGELPEDEAYWSVAPGLIVEVLSPGNTTAEIDRKLSELFSVGCKLAWVIDPATKSAKVYTSAKKFKELDSSGILDGGKVLPGFKLPLANLFASTKRRKKKPR